MFYAIISLQALLYTVIKKLTYTQPLIRICLTRGMTDRPLVFLPTYFQLHKFYSIHTLLHVQFGEYFQNRTYPL